MNEHYEFIRAGEIWVFWFVISAIGGVAYLVLALFNKISESKQNKKDAEQEQDYFDRIQELTNDNRHEDLMFTMSHIIKVTSIKGDKFNNLKDYVQSLKFACAGLGKPVRESFFDELLDNSLQVAKDWHGFPANLEEWQKKDDLPGFEKWMEEFNERTVTFSNSMDEELGITGSEDGETVGWKMKNYKFTYQNSVGEVVDKIIEIPNMDD